MTQTPTPAAASVERAQRFLESAGRRSISLRAVLVGLCLVALAGWAPGAQAAPAYENWSPPVQLSHPDTPATQPDIVADPSGRVHVTWLERLQTNTQCVYDSIVYASYVGGEWIEARDVLISPRGWCISEHAMALEAQPARLHVVFSDYQLYHSSAVAGDAQDPRAWSSPVVIDPAGAKYPVIAVDEEGRIHVAYYRAQPDWQVCYARSDDGGNQWTSPECIHDAPEGYRIDNVHLAAGGQGRVYVVWTDESTASGMSRGGTVYYARSRDGGLTWDPSQIVDEKRAEYQADYGAGEINVAAIGDQVHLVWAGPPAGQRWHKWSADGGTTWQAARPVAPQDTMLRWYNGGMALAADSEGRLHLISSSDPIKHLRWDQGQWSPVETINQTHPFWPRLAIAQGNQLFVVSASTREGGQVPLEEMRVWVTTAQTNAPVLPPQLTATQAPEARPSATSTAKAGETAQAGVPVAGPTATRPHPAPGLPATAPDAVTFVPLIVSLGPVAVLLLAVVGVFVGRRKGLR